MLRDDLKFLSKKQDELNELYEKKKIEQDNHFWLMFVLFGIACVI